MSNTNKKLLHCIANLPYTLYKYNEKPVAFGLCGERVEILTVDGRDWLVAMLPSDFASKEIDLYGELVLRGVEPDDFVLCENCQNHTDLPLLVLGSLDEC